jgi:hypothetical protein
MNVPTPMHSFSKPKWSEASGNADLFFPGIIDLLATAHLSFLPGMEKHQGGCQRWLVSTEEVEEGCRIAL